MFWNDQWQQHHPPPIASETDTRTPPFIYTDGDLTHGGEESREDQQHHENARVADTAHPSWLRDSCPDSWDPLDPALS